MVSTILASLSQDSSINGLQVVSKLAALYQRHDSKCNLKAHSEREHYNLWTVSETFLSFILLHWVCVAMFCSGGDTGVARGVLEASPMCDRAYVSRLQDRPATDQS